VLAPTAGDSVVLERLLVSKGIAVKRFDSLLSLAGALGEETGIVIISEEAIVKGEHEALKKALGQQPTWSDIPILLLSSQAERIFSTEAILQSFEPGGNITVLERPFRITTLLSAVRVALRARHRQFEVKKILSDMAQALSQRNEFLSVASHELKTPLTSLKIQIQMRERMIRKGDAGVFQPDRVLKLVTFAAQQIDRLNRLVDDMLDVSRITNGKLEVSPSFEDLDSLIRNLIGVFEEFPAWQALSLTYETPGSVVAEIDKFRIEQVITNLLTNAAKYGGGTPITVRLSTDGQSALIEVSDQGKGIKPEDHERIFNRFERAVTTNEISGFGLGLYICRQIIQLHGGRIWVESEVGRGSTFKIQLPLGAK